MRTKILSRLTLALAIIILQPFVHGGADYMNSDKSADNKDIRIDYFTDKLSPIVENYMDLPVNSDFMKVVQYYIL